MTTTNIIIAVAGLAGAYLLLQDSGIVQKIKGYFTTKKSSIHSFDEMLDEYLACEADRTPEKDLAVRAGLDILIEHCIKHDIHELHPGLTKE